MKVLLFALVAAAAAKESTVEKAASDAVSSLEKVGVDTVYKRGVVAGVVGLAGGMVVKKTVDTVMTCALLGGAAVGGACYIGWITPAQMEDAASKATEAANKAKGYYESLFGSAADDVKEKVKKSKIIMSNVYKRAPGLVVGGAVGSLIGYRLG